MRILPTIFLIACGAVFTVFSVRQPDLLASNDFLSDFVRNQFINVIVVIVTVSLVSITQINLEYSRIERRFKKRVFQVPRKSLNLSGAILVLILFVSLLLSFLKAHFSSSLTAASFIHSLALIVLFEAAFIMYDLIRVVYTLAADEPLE